MIPNPVSPFSWNEGSIKVIRHVEPNRVLRVGAVAYLNTKPLIYGMQDRLGDSGELSLELPSRLADELDNATIDVGLIPVAEYFRHLDRYVRVSNAVIACDGPVWSVRAFFKLDPAKVRTLAVDEGSRTSVALIQVLYHLIFPLLLQ